MKKTSPPLLTDKSKTLLKEKGLSITQPRKTILEFLLENHGPFSIEEIHQKIGESACDLATVYRCMGQFEKEELVEKRFLGDETLRYEFRDESHHHHHIICRNCKNVTPMDYCLISEVEKMIQDKGYTNITHSLEFFGICPECNVAN